MMYVVKKLREYAGLVIVGAILLVCIVGQYNLAQNSRIVKEVEINENV